MRYRLIDVEAHFRYGSLGTTDGSLTCLDIKKWYQNLGGRITPYTYIEFETYFPGKPYRKTDLTDDMPENYLCEGSGSAVIYRPNGQVDVISVSVYKDIRGDQLAVDHHNLYLQYQINGKKDHTNKIPNRHIPLQNGVIIKPFINSAEIKEKTAIVQA